MSSIKKYSYDKKSLEIYERLTVPFAIYQFVDKKIVTIAISDGFCQLFGYDDPAKAYFDMDNDMYRDVHPDDISRIANAAYSFATKDSKYDVLYRAKPIDSSEYRIIHSFGKHVYTDEGIRLAHIWYSDEGAYIDNSTKQEIRLNQALNDALHESSYTNANQYDYLTGLPNMTYFFEIAEAGKARAQKRGIRPIMMYMNFSGMKFYNMNHGFAEGDKLLQSFAKMLAKIYGSKNCCRISADHFTVHTEQDVLENKLQQMLNAYSEMNSESTLPLHIGIYVGQNENIHTSIAIDRAKLACSSLSGRYETAVRYYDKNLSDDSANKQYIIENIDRALSEKWIKAYFQPIVRTVNERVCDVEVLARWIDPEKGFLPPINFIPALEDTGLIYKLDLYMVDQVIKSIKKQQNDGVKIVPYSINLSRSDFDNCDMVEEIRKRIDEAGIDHDKITIEITESILGSDFEFIKKQIERFQDLGFPVWMDDFGSGYSSLNILQSIRFDLIKFDMKFMRQLDENENGRVLLAELMRMATSLGLDTVCEGVETEEQVLFLREIGCSKLQGFYFGKPEPFEPIFKKYKENALLENENPDESGYYESISRVNLYDLGVIISENENTTNNVFNMLPVAILETDQDQDTYRYLRSNRSYQDFAKRFFNIDILSGQTIHGSYKSGYIKSFNSLIRECCDTGSNAFFDEVMPDGSTVHAFMRRIDVNPVTGNAAVALAILSIKKADESTTYAEITRALAADYYNIFIIDLDTDSYTEYVAKVAGEELSTERHGENFFESAKHDTMVRIFEEDRQFFLAEFTKEKILQTIASQGIFTLTYRLIDTGTPVYVNMKVSKMSGSNRIILGVSNVDAQMKEKMNYEELQKEKDTFTRIMALSDGYLTIYTVDPDTGDYSEYSSTKDYDSLNIAKSGKDFFYWSMVNAETCIYEPDRKLLRESFTKENVMKEIKKNGKYRINYNLLLNDTFIPVSLKAALFKDGDTDKLIIGVREWTDRK